MCIRTCTTHEDTSGCPNVQDTRAHLARLDERRRTVLPCVTDIVGDGGCPTPLPGRDKSGPYALGIASLAIYGQFANNIRDSAKTW